MYKEIEREREKERLDFVSPGAFCRIQLGMGSRMNLRSIEPESTTNLVRGTGATRRYIEAFLHEADPCRPRNRTDVEEVETKRSSTVPLSWTRRG